MGLEQEVKFLYSDFDQLRHVLASTQARFVHKVFEQNRVYDTGEGDLKRAGALLRLRQAQETVLCLKTPPRDKEKTDDSRVKTWEEIQTAVQDGPSMHALLLGLGYHEVFCYQKVREKWLLGTCMVCLDQLPFGHFVEIEGDPDQIWEAARALELNVWPWTTKSYHQLHREWRQQNNLPEEESFVFSAQERARILAELPGRPGRTEGAEGTE